MRARELWRVNGSLNYTYSRRESGCFCPEELTRPVLVIIRDGVRVVPVADKDVLRFGGGPVTVPEYFDYIARLIKRNGPTKISIEYDPRDGHPYAIENPGAKLDDNWLIEIQGLRHDG